MSIRKKTLHPSVCTMFWEIFRFRLRNAVVQTARNISERRKLTFNLSLTVHAVRSILFCYSH